VSATTTILVCGDRSRGDDGAALVAIDRLAPPLPAGVRIERVGQVAPDDLLAALGSGRCLVVDVVRGVSPGRIIDLPLHEVADRRAASSSSSHALPLETAIRLAAELGADLSRGTFLGIGGSRFGLGDPISATVRAGIDAFSRAIVLRAGVEGVVTCV
jgi:hydrogenase maturation protease